MAKPKIAKVSQQLNRLMHNHTLFNRKKGRIRSRLHSVSLRLASYISSDTVHIPYVVNVEIEAGWIEARER